MTILKPEECVVFFGKQSPASNWFEAGFVYRDDAFRTNEQFMMYYKARLFNDEYYAPRILKARSPKRAKRYGKLVQGFSEEIWSQWDTFIVGKGKTLQAAQNPIVLDFLLMHRDKTFIEASPYDTKWGVGLEAHDPRIYDTDQWLGANRLGFVLGAVAQYLFLNVKR